MYTKETLKRTKELAIYFIKYADKHGTEEWKAQHKHELSCIRKIYCPKN